jgi:gliding motility-associated-like protein
MKLILLTLIVLFAPIIVNSQTRVILNRSYLVFHGGTSTRPVFFVVDNSDPNALVNLSPCETPCSNSGGIISENEFHIVQWQQYPLSSSVITIPFSAKQNKEYIPVNCHLEAPPLPIAVSLRYSTSSASSDNTPLPSNVTTTNNCNGDESGYHLIDRYWYFGNKDTTSPKGKIQLTYLESEMSLPNEFSESEIGGLRFETNWQYWKYESNEKNNTNINKIANTYFSPPVTFSTQSSTWTLGKFNSITLANSEDSASRTTCKNSEISPITFLTTGATGANFLGLPQGVNGSWNDNEITINGAPANSGLSEFTINLTGGCGAISKTGEITIHPLPLVNAGNNQIVCEKDSISLSATGATFYSWDNNIENATLFTPPIGTTLYTVIGTDDNGCSNISQTQITSNPIPIVSVLDVEVCEGMPATLSATCTIEGGSYLWDTGDTSSTITTNPTTTTYYYVEYTVNGCTSPFGTGKVTLTEKPTVSVNSATLCPENSDVTIIATGSPVGGDYLWGNGEIGASITVSPEVETTYFIQYTVNDCVSSTKLATVWIGTTPNINAGPDLKICSKETAIIAATGGDNYEWSHNLGNQSSISVSPPTTTTYYVSGTNASGCSKVDTVIIEVNPTPSISINVGGSLPLQYGETISLVASGADFYNWFGATDIACDTCTQITLKPQKNTTYCAQGTTKQGCVGTYCTAIEVVNNCSTVYIPTAFSPNGDGNNDAFRVRIPDLCTTNYFKFLIFNRLGEKVFESNELKNGWDGKHKEMDQNNEMFAYFLEMKINGKDELITRKGKIVLIK